MLMVDFYEYSTPELVRLLGERFKEYRMRCNLTQKEVAEQSGIGLTTIHKFENGTAGNLSLSTFLSLSVSIVMVRESYILRHWQPSIQRQKVMDN